MEEENRPMQEKELAYSLWLASIVGIGATRAETMLSETKSVEEIYRMNRSFYGRFVGDKVADVIEQSKKEWDVFKKYEQLKQDGILFYPSWHEEYPERLKSISKKPVGIYVKGKLPLEEQKAIAMIGTRNCTQYGSYIAKEFAQVLAKSKVEIISGMARGIDSISQKAALDVGGNSYAVFGCGVDVCYPKSCQKLYEQLIEQGGVISTYSPKTVPKPELFPPRNRIISGLCDAVLVVEASIKSGTMITVDMALEQGRDVYVIPGRLTDRTSDGCNQLIKQGASVVLSPEDLLKELEMGWFVTTNVSNSFSFTKEEKKIWDILDFQPKSLQEILYETKELSMKQIMDCLIQMCMKGSVLCIEGSYYVKKQDNLVSL